MLNKKPPLNLAMLPANWSTTTGEEWAAGRNVRKLILQMLGVPLPRDGLTTEWMPRRKKHRRQVILSRVCVVVNVAVSR